MATFLLLSRVFFKTIAKVVEIEFGRHTITFSLADKKTLYAPLIHISNSRKRDVILGIGSDMVPTEPCFTVDLFEYAEEMIKEISPRLKLKDIYSLFFRSAFIRLFNRNNLIYVKARVIGIENVDLIEKEYFKKQLLWALTHAGAVECAFIETKTQSG